MTIIYFIRHAHSMYTPDEYNRPLSESGRQESAKLVHLFKKLDITAMYASRYLRAVETIEPIAQNKGMTIQQIEALNERQLSATHVADFQLAIHSVWQNPNFALPGGESNNAAQSRVLPIITQLTEKHQDEAIIIGTHGNIFTLILNYYDASYDLSFWNELKMPDVHKVTIEGNRLHSVRRLSYESFNSTNIR